MLWWSIRYYKRLSYRLICFGSKPLLRGLSSYPVFFVWTWAIIVYRNDVSPAYVSQDQIWIYKINFESMYSRHMWFDRHSTHISYFAHSAANADIAVHRHSQSPPASQLKFGDAICRRRVHNYSYAFVWSIIRRDHPVAIFMYVISSYGFKEYTIIYVLLYYILIFDIRTCFKWNLPACIVETVHVEIFIVCNFQSTLLENVALSDYPAVWFGPGCSSNVSLQNTNSVQGSIVSSSSLML